MEIVIGSIGAFMVILTMVLGALDMFHLAVHGDPTKIRERLRVDEAKMRAEAVAVEIVRKDAISDRSLLERILERFGPVTRVQLLLRHADSQMPIGVFFLLSLVLAGVGGLAGYSAGLESASLAGAIVGGGALPLFYQKHRKKRRLKMIETQLPDALDLIARTLQAGHAFMMGLKTVAEQVEDPIGSEFQKAVDEINFGVSVGEAMKGMSERVDSVDVKFFVTSLLVQLETGGNLAEIIQSISSLIRARFELFGKVRALSAEGRISAGIMFALPLLVGSALYVINDEYIGLLFTDELGHKMLTGGISMMLLGAFVTRRMIAIKV